MQNKKLKKEFAGDYSMAGARRFDTPGNIRYGQLVRGDRVSHFDNDQDNSSFPKAAIVYVRKGNKVLAVSRGDDLSDMNMPGGGVDLGEDPRDAAIRELWEETGLIAHELFPIYSKNTGGRIVTVFKVISYSGKLRPSHEGVPDWVDPSVLSSSTYGKFFDEVLESLSGDTLIG